MSILVCGANHKTADIAIREKLALNKTQQAALLADLLADTTATQAVVLMTCNRTEIYTDAKKVSRVLEVILKHCHLDKKELLNSYYECAGQAAVEHIMRVACGLDSMVLGETEIFGQMKAAFAFAQTQDTIGTELQRLAQAVFTLAKHVRATSKLGACPVSVASIAVRQASSAFGDLSNASVLLVGAGNTMKLIAKYFNKARPKTVTVANRHLTAAKEVAALCDGQAITLAQLHDCLVDVDVVISATASQLPLLGKGAIESALKQRPKRAMILMDMALPRDIEPEVAALKNVQLFTIDDLKNIAQENQLVREHAASKAMDAITQAAKFYIDWLNGLDSTSSLKAFRTHVDCIREAEISKAIKLLKQGGHAEDIIRRLAHGLTNKLMHQPSVQLRQAGNDQRNDFLTLVHELFGLEKNDDKPQELER
jgi:glutamyl-tRNA reductase